MFSILASGMLENNKASLFPPWVLRLMADGVLFVRRGKTMWVIKPKKSVGPLSIGDKIRDAKEKLGNEYDTFKRVPDAEDTVFAFDPCGVHLTCGYDEKVKIISVFRPNSESKFQPFNCGILLCSRKPYLTGTPDAAFFETTNPPKASFR